jgi:hypothetical protein
MSATESPLPVEQFRRHYNRAFPEAAFNEDLHPLARGVVWHAPASG